jgi:hypothetical protein
MGFAERRSTFGKIENTDAARTTVSHLDPTEGWRKNFTLTLDEIDEDFEIFS